MSPRIVILTGPDLSAESGIPTFRGSNELWKGHRIEEIASPETVGRNPALVHEFYDLRRRTARTAMPTAAHYSLADLGYRLGDDVVIVTQNVDDLHERAGSDNVIHIYGELNKAWCTSCGKRWVWEADLEDNPPCPSCQQHALRPDIVWFGEKVRRLDEVHAAVGNCELLVAIGTSGNLRLAGFVARPADGQIRQQESA